MSTVSSADHEEAVRETGPRTVVHVEVDQIVAMNIRYWRRIAGMTQEDLGNLLGWSAANVSAAERSADEKRERRRFDAGTLTALCVALRVPLIALFLPPEDDGDGNRYMFPACGASRDMADLMTLAIMPDRHDDDDVMADYRLRLTLAVTRYMDTDWAKEVARWLRDRESAELRADRAAHLRLRRAELLATAEELADLADAIDPAGDADGR